jgi:hypothetical protein
MNFFSLKFKNKIFKLFHVYIILMLLFYFGYILLDSFRFKPNGLASKDFLTSEDIASFTQLAKWTSSFELMFLFLFIFTMIICCFRKKINILKRFITINTVLFFGIGVISLILYFITPSPIGNLTEPLIIPLFLTGALSIYMLWLSKKGTLNNAS